VVGVAVGVAVAVGGVIAALPCSHKGPRRVIRDARH
jgi:hypothetical protein